MGPNYEPQIIVRGAMNFEQKPQREPFFPIPPEGAAITPGGIEPAMRITREHLEHRLRDGMPPTFLGRHINSIAELPTQAEIDAAYEAYTKSGEKRRLVKQHSQF